MSDLDDLASAARGGTPRRPPAPSPPPGRPGPAAAPPSRPPQPQAPQPQAVEPEPAWEPSHPVVGGGVGVAPTVWVWLAVGLVVVLGLAFWLINRDTGGTTSDPGTVAQGTPPAAPAAKSSVPTTAPPGELPADEVPPVAAPASAATTPPAPAAPPRGPWVLEDIADPLQAIDVYHLQRVENDQVEIKLRNKSKQGVWVRALEFYAETDDRLPLGESITFWLPPGGLVVTTRRLADMPRRLGETEGIKTVVADAEFRATEPEELRARAAGGDGAPAELDEGSEKGRGATK